MGKKELNHFPSRRLWTWGQSEHLYFDSSASVKLYLYLQCVFPPFLSAKKVVKRTLEPTWNSRCQLPCCAVWQMDDCRSSFINNHFVLIPQTALNEVKQWTFMPTNRRNFTLWGWTTYRSQHSAAENMTESTVSTRFSCFLHCCTARLILEQQNSSSLLYHSSLAHLLQATTPVF